MNGSTLFRILARLAPAAVLLGLAFRAAAQEVGDTTFLAGTLVVRF